MVKQSSEYGLALDGPDLRRQTDRNRIILGVQRPVTQALMRPQAIVVIGVSLNNVIEVFQSKTEEVVQALSLERPDPRFRVAVGDGAAEGRSDGLGFHGCDQPVERGSVLSVPITEQELHLQLFILQPHAGITDLLEDPFFVGVIGPRRDQDLPTTQVDEHQPIGDVLACGCPDVLAEEVCGDDDIGVRFDKGPPRGCDPMRSIAFGIGQDPFLFQGPPDRSTADGQCQLLELTDDPPGTPAGVLLASFRISARNEAVTFRGRPTRPIVRIASCSRSHRL